MSIIQEISEYLQKGKPKNVKALVEHKIKNVLGSENKA